MKYISKILLVSMFSFFVLFLSAQDDTNMNSRQKRKAEKEKQKKEKEEKDAADWLIYQKLAANKTYAIQFDRIVNTPVSKRLNFLYVNGNRVVLQFETNSYWSENGLGGRTFDGVISNYKYKAPKNKNKPIYISFDMTSKFDQQQFNISITVYGSGSSQISLGGGTASVYGNFLPIEEANINIGNDMRN